MRHSKSLMCSTWSSALIAEIGDKKKLALGQFFLLFAFTTTTRWKSEKSQKENTRRKHTQKTRRQQHARLAVVPRGNNQLSRSGRRHCCWPSESLPQPMVFLLSPPLFPPLLTVPRPARCCLLWGNKMSKSSGRRHGKWSRLSRTTQPRPSACLLPSTDYSLPTYPKLSGTRGVYVLFRTLYI